MSHDGPRAADADLVAGVLAGDREAFAAVYDRYADRLHDFAHSLLRHREEAADSVADAFVVMAERLEQLRDPELLRPWLYSVVRHECLRRIKARDRQAYEAEERLAAMAEAEPGPAERAEQVALRELLDAAAAGLNERDRTVLDLHLRHGLDGAELGEAIGATAGATYTLMNRLRGQVERSLGALLVARQGRRECPALAQLLDGWDGRFTPLVRKRVARHVESCAVCDSRRALLVAPGALLSVAPLLAAPLALRERVLDDPRLVGFWRDGAGPAAAGTAAGTPDDGAAQAGAGPVRDRRRSRSLVATVAAAVVLAILGGATALLWSLDQDDTGLLAGRPDLRQATSTSTGPVATVTVPDATAVPRPTPSKPPRGATKATPTPPPATAASPSPTPTPQPSPSPTPTPQPSPGALNVSTRLLELGPGVSRARVRVTNTGGRAVDFAVAPQAGWIAVAPSGGTVGPGAAVDLLVEVTRGALPEGVATSRVAITWSGPTVPVDVRVTTQRPPVVSGITVTTSGPCSPGRTVVVSATVTDESDLDAVRLVWRGSGSGEVAMTRGPSGWVGQIGPFPPLAELVATVRATDVLGALGTGSSRFVVQPCPG
jgi:RNA polymerase sigma factor (sigma-70 family)